MHDAQIKIVAMPSDVDKEGKIQAGWVLKQLDLAAGIAVKELTGQRSVTIAMDKVCFKEPILVGDYILCYASVMKTGKTSIRIQLQIDLKRLTENGFEEKKEVVSAEAVFVSLDKQGNKICMSDFLKQNHE